MARGFADPGVMRASQWVEEVSTAKIKRKAAVDLYEVLYDTG